MPEKTPGRRKKVGRPKGSRNKLTEATRKIISEHFGDPVIAMCKLATRTEHIDHELHFHCLKELKNMYTPKLKAVAVSTPFFLPDDDAYKAQGDAVIKAMSKGEMPAEIGERILNSLKTVAELEAVDKVHSQMKDMIEFMETAKL